MRLRFLGPASMVGMGIAGALVAVARDARACGGCFAPPGENDSVVTDHRMILSVSSQQTTLWDQIEYSGSPSSFAWVLPVSDAKVATLGLSADVVFGSLDTLTKTTVQQPPLNCPPPSDCDEAFDNAGGATAPEAADAGAPGVDVTKHEVVGPYDVAFLHSTDANALNSWLTDHDYSIPADVAPVIAAYVSAHYDFVAMKLVPGAGVQAMRPVRVSTPGAAPVLPLRMVAAGTGPIVSITLWVIGEGRWDPQNFPTFTITSDQLTWDWTTSSSDYAALRASNNASTHNTAWEMESSTALQSFQLETLIQNGGNTFANGADAGSDYAPIDPVDGGPDASSTAGETADQVRDDDIAALFAGMNQDALRVTRMRADLAHASLASDLALQAANDQSILSNVRTPSKEANEPLCPVYDGCAVVGQAPRSQAVADQEMNKVMGGKSAFSCASAPQRLHGRLFAALGAMLGIAALRARRARRDRRRGG